MRCQSCNKILSDFEATRFDPVTKKYPDLCNSCIPSIIRERCRERNDLSQDAYDDITDGDDGDFLNSWEEDSDTHVDHY